ncbi:MAG: hypothetical protein LBB42_02015 [Coriobacteriales bacterium]|nr:hypothetical protein [Coriobacteriales bacterium]
MGTYTFTIKPTKGTQTKAAYYDQFTAIGHVKAYKVGVIADYYCDGKKITKWNSVRKNFATYLPGWTYSNVKTSWAIKGSTLSQARASGTFKYGLNTHWIKIRISSYSEEINMRLSVKK